MSTATPKLVTIIMPVRNEAAHIAASLGAVLAQDYPADRLEILVVDGESEDATRAIVHALPGSQRVRLLSNPRHRQAAGLNLAIQVAAGEVIVRVDGHALIAPDYVRMCVAELERTGAEAVGGLMEPFGVTATGRAIACALQSRFGVPTAFHVSARPQLTDTVYMGAWPCGVFDRVGLFDETLRANEDYDLFYRLRQAGGKVFLSPAIRSRYYGRQTLRALAAQQFAYGIGKSAMLRKSLASVRPRHLVAPAFVASLVIGALLATVSPLARLMWLAIVLAYAAANLAATVVAARRTPLATAWRVPFAFLTMHLAWGAGVWVGMLGLRPQRGGSSAGMPATLRPVQTDLDGGGR